MANVKDNEKSREEIIPGFVEEGKEFTSLSGIPVKPYYTQADVDAIDYEKEVGDPGTAPFVRGNYPEGYRRKLWYIRQISGMNTPEWANERMKFLFERGQDSFCPAYDQVTKWGLDPMDDRVKYEIGNCGVGLDTKEDYASLFKDIPLERINVTIDSPIESHVQMLCEFFTFAEEYGMKLKTLHGNSSNCPMFSAFTAPGIDLIPPDAIVKLFGDVVEWCCRNVPNWHPLLVNGYVIREAGVNAYQEVAYNFITAEAIIDEVIKRETVEVDQFLPGIIFNFSAHTDFFEEIAKFRAAKKVWYKLMKEKYQPKRDSSCMLRYHVQTAGSSYASREPLNNIIRGTLESLSAALGGVQSMMVCSCDEGLGLPLQGTALLAVRTQQILQHETNVTNIVDPLGGSYYIEHLTNEMEKKIWDYREKIIQAGGFVKGLTSGWIPSEFRKEQAKNQSALDTGKIKLVGVNCFESAEEHIELPAMYEERVNIEGNLEYEREKLEKLKKERDNNKVQKALDELLDVAKSGENVMPATMNAVKVLATSAEISDVWRKAYGIWQSPCFA